MSEGEENSAYDSININSAIRLSGLTAPLRMLTTTIPTGNVYRLTWIYFAEAEALMRKNGGAATQDAVDLINTCRNVRLQLLIKLQNAIQLQLWPWMSYLLNAAANLYLKASGEMTWFAGISLQHILVGPPAFFCHKVLFPIHNSNLTWTLIDTKPRLQLNTQTPKKTKRAVQMAAFFVLRICRKLRIRLSKFFLCKT